MRPIGAPTASAARCIETGTTGSATGSGWGFAMTGSRSGFGMPPHFVLPSAARPYIVSITDSLLSAGRTSTLKLTLFAGAIREVVRLAGLDRDDVADAGLDPAAVDPEAQRAL